MRIDITSCLLIRANAGWQELGGSSRGAPKAGKEKEKKRRKGEAAMLCEENTKREGLAQAVAAQTRRDAKHKQQDRQGEETKGRRGAQAKKRAAQVQLAMATKNAKAARRGRRAE